MHPTVSGAARSKTIWLGFFITLFGYLQANIHTFAPWWTRSTSAWPTCCLGFW